MYMVNKDKGNPLYYFTSTCICFTLQKQLRSRSDILRGLRSISEVYE